MNEILDRNEIEGQSIKAILRGPFREFDGATACSVFVELANRCLLELVSEEELRTFGFRRLQPRSDLTLAFADGSERIAGESITDVVCSDLLPTVGVRLSNGLIVCACSTLPYCVGPCLFPMSEYYRGEIFSFWDGHEIK